MTINMTEANIIRQTAAGPLTANQVESALPPGYLFSSDMRDTPDGQHLYRVRFTHPNAKTTLLFFGGNMSTVGKAAVPAATELTKNWTPNLVFVDYRGYGQSSGTANLAALHNDALQVFDDERERATASGKSLVLAGFSLGGMVAGSVLEKRKPDGVMLIATATNVTQWIGEATPWYTKPFLNFKIDPALLTVDNSRAVRGYQGPVLIVAAEIDSQVPAVLSEKLFVESATPPEKKRLAIAAKTDHNDVMQSKEFNVALNAFVMQNGF